MATVATGIDLTDVLCANEETGTIFSNPDSCTMYYYCHEDTTYEVECPTGFYFDSSSVSCQKQKPDDSKCGLCFNLIDGDLVKMAGSCSKYGVCKDKVVAEERYCADDEAFDTNDFTCKSNEIVQCDKRCDNVDKPFFGDVNDCRNYLYCDDSGNLKVEQCTDGLYFDSERIICGYEADVKCAKGDK